MAMIDGAQASVWRRLLWMAAIWAASVAFMFVCAAFIHWCIRF